MKKTDIEKAKALKTVGKMKLEGIPGRFGSTAEATADRRAQRKQDQAQGLVSFPVKLKQDVINTIRERAAQQQVSTNDVIGQLLQEALKPAELRASIQKGTESSEEKTQTTP